MPLTGVYSRDVYVDGHETSWLLVTTSSQWTSRRLLPDGDRVIIYRQQCFGFFTLLEHTEMTLRLEGKARRRALAKARRLRQESAIPAAEPPQA